MNQNMDLVYLNLEFTNPEARPGKGPIPCEMAFVGIAPSPNRPLSRRNEPFGASSWGLLQKIQIKLDKPIYTTNLVKEPVPATKKPGIRLVRYYYPQLMAELKIVKPKKILALGALPAQLLCPGFDSLREDHGTYFYNPELEALVVPTYHFSAIGRDPSKIDLLIRDLERFERAPSGRVGRPVYKLNSLPGLNSEKLYDVYLDIETSGLNPQKDQLLSLGLGISEPNSNDLDVYLFDPIDQDTLHQLHELFQSNNCRIIGHNLQFDLGWLDYHSGDNWSHFVQTVDTMFLAHVAGEEVLALKHLTTLHTERPGSRAFGGPDDLDYLAEDIYSTYEIHQYFKKWEDTLSASILNRLLPYFISMKDRGVCIDRMKLKELLVSHNTEVQQATGILESSGKINWNSHQQVANYLLDHGVPLIEKTDAGNYSVKETVLVELAKSYPIAEQILKMREKIKELEFLKSYLEKTSDDDPFLHPRLKPTGTKTGRLSCEDPNVQQVKRTGPIKTLFRSRHTGGYVGLVDLSQAELRVIAMLSGDQKFAEALLSEDVHVEMASISFEIPKEEVDATRRKKSKAITFGLIYGGSTQGLANRAMLSEDAVEHVLKRISENFPALWKYIEKTKRIGVKNQEVFTLFGKRRSLRPLIQISGERDAARKAVNTPVQGTASEITLFLMLKISEALYHRGKKSSVIFGVHDSILLDVHPDEVHDVAHYVQEAFRALGSTNLAELSLYPILPIVGELIMGKTWAHIESTNESYDPENNLEFPCSSLDLSIHRGGVTSERTEILDAVADESDEPIQNADEE